MQETTVSMNEPGTGLKECPKMDEVDVSLVDLKVLWSI